MELTILVIVEIVFFCMEKYYKEPIPEPKTPELFNRSLQANHAIDGGRRTTEELEKHKVSRETCISFQPLYVMRLIFFLCHIARDI